MSRPPAPPPPISERLRIVTRPGHPDFLDLPWTRPLDTWDVDRLVEVTRGIHRHVVRFVDYDGALYALKELPDEFASREYRLLRRMAEEGVPAVDGVGVVRREGLDDVLITRYLDYSLPYRMLFTHRRAAGVPDLSSRLLDALAMLLVRLHLTGFYWGDCSLSNTLFRRDAGGLAAYLVDAETGEWHAVLSDGQRENDLEVTMLNVAGGLMDVQAQLDLPPDPDPIELAYDLRHRYDLLWDELTTEQVVGVADRHLIETRIRRLNDLGFDVEEVEMASTEGGDVLVMRLAVVEAGHHQRRLLTRTGLVAQENQARALLNDIAGLRARMEWESGRPVAETVATHRWLSDVFEPAIAAIPEELRGKLEPVELFHEIIEHKWFLSERAGRDVGLQPAVDSYMRDVLPSAPDERTVITARDESRDGWISYG
jgi:hypothetical protein